ncbi:autotransporter domain-containing protein [Fusobacterium varium]|nr:autotransporter domain-containing protein [Fusobacterium varium]
MEKSKKLSVEGDAGLEIGKDLYYNDYKVTLKAGVNIYHEFTNPYDDTDVKLRNVSADTLKLANNDTRKDVSLRIELEKNNSFGIYGEYKHLFDDENMFQIGMNYGF